MKNKGLAAVLLAVSIASVGQNVYAAELPCETQEEIAEEEYWDSLELLALCVEAEARQPGSGRKAAGGSSCFKSRGRSGLAGRHYGSDYPEASVHILGKWGD